MRKILIGSLLVAAIATLTLVALAALYTDRDPRHAVARRCSPVDLVLREPVPSLGPRVERWRIVTTAGDTLGGLWRGAPPGHDAPWTVVLLGGIHTDDRAALVVPPETPVNVLGMSWPWRGPRRMSLPRLLLEVPAIREAWLCSPAVLAAGAEAASREPEGARERVAVLGASLGVPPAITAMSLGDHARALILVDGGADLVDLVRHELKREKVSPAIAPHLARVAVWLLAPLEPRLHAPAARERRVLMFNARQEERLPPGSVDRLQALFPHARVEWRETVHIRPRHTEVIAGIANSAATWLSEGPPPPPR